MNLAYSPKKRASSDYQDIREDLDRKNRVIIIVYDHCEELNRKKQWVNSSTKSELQNWSALPTRHWNMDRTAGLMFGQGALPAESWSTEHWFGHGLINQLVGRQRETTVPKMHVELSFEEHLRDFRRSKNAVLTVMCSRILELHQFAIEEEDQDMLSVESFLSLAKFILLNNPPVVPSLVLTTNGHLRAEWRINSINRIALEFLADEEVRFVLFARNKRDRLKVTRISGSTTIADIFDEISEEHARDFGVLPD